MADDCSFLFPINESEIASATSYTNSYSALNINKVKEINVKNENKND